MDYADVTKPESSDLNNKLSTEISMRPYYHLYLKKNNLLFSPMPVAQ